MFTKAILSVSLIGAAAAFAAAHPDPEVNHLLQVRDTTAQCSVPANILSIVETIPTPAADLEAAVSTITNWCTTPSFTGTIESEWVSWESAVLEWAVENSAALESFSSYAATACPSLTAAAGGIPVCTTGAGASGKTGTATGAAATTTHKGAAAPQVTMFAAAAGLVAGAMGVLVL